MTTATFEGRTVPIDYLAKRPQVVADSECYPNLWAIGFKDVDSGKKVILAMRQGEELDRPRIAKIMFNHRMFTFNGNHYDMPMLAYALKGANTAALKKLNDEIIIQQLMPWEAYDIYDMRLPDFLDHVDLFQVAPSAAQMFSLKKYAGVMGCKRMQELPYDPDTWLTKSQINDVLEYLHNDLDVTDELRDEMTPQVELRAQLSAKYNFDFRSKSDAQCGEAVIKLLVERHVGQRIYKPDIEPGPFQYEAPAYIKFQTPYMQDMLNQLLRSRFLVKGDGYVQMSELFMRKKSKAKEIEVDEEAEYEGGAEIRIGNNVYKMGIGGLHSQEKSVSHFADDENDLVDTDVTGYYPNLMLRAGQEPDNMRGLFVPIFKGLVDDREAAKKAGQKAKAESMKIFTNGLFGKTGSPYSIVYSPHMMIQTTVTGQLSILMLIEELSMRGFEVISVNTDGVVTVVPKVRRGEFRSVVYEWEWTVGLHTEETMYRSIHARDVNSYVAFIIDGKIKRKGAYAPSGRGIPGAFGLKKTPNLEICVEAAIGFLKDGTPPERVVRNCQDIRKFVVVRKVTGGAEKDMQFIGKTVRYYLSAQSPGPLNYVTSGNRVPNSDGAQPCMELPDELPCDIDYEAYERESYAILHDMGMDVPDPTLKGRHGSGFGRRDDQKTVHTIDWATGLAYCGMQRKSRRDLWVEYRQMPSEFKLCSKCRKAGEL